MKGHGNKWVGKWYYRKQLQMMLLLVPATHENSKGMLPVLVTYETSDDKLTFRMVVTKTRNGIQ